MLQFVEHGLDGFVIVCEGFADAGRQSRVFDKFLQAFAGEIQVRFATIIVFLSLRLFADPGPSGQPVEHPLQYVH